MQEALGEMVQTPILDVFSDAQGWYNAWALSATLYAPDMANAFDDRVRRLIEQAL